MTEYRFFEAGTVPEYTTPEWYRGLDRAPHLEQQLHGVRLRLAAEFVKQGIRDYGAKSVSDMGAGDGGLLWLINDMGVRCWGYDLIEANVEAARKKRGVDIQLKDVLTEAVNWGFLAVMTEFLEHLVAPHAFLKACPSRVVVASSPNGEEPHCHCEFHAWGWGTTEYRTMFEKAGYDVVRQDPGPFQTVLGVRR